MLSLYFRRFSLFDVMFTFSEKIWEPWTPPPPDCLHALKRCGRITRAGWHWDMTHGPLTESVYGERVRVPLIGFGAGWTTRRALTAPRDEEIFVFDQNIAAVYCVQFFGLGTGAVEKQVRLTKTRQNGPVLDHFVLFWMIDWLID